MIPRQSLIAASVLFLCFGYLRAQSRPDSVSLRFGWPVGLTAYVEQEWSRTKHLSGRTDSTGMRGSYRMSVLAHPEGQLIQTDSFAVAPITTKNREAGILLQHIVSQMSAFSPSYIISPEGEFRRVEDVQRMKSAMDSLIAPLLEDLPPKAKSFLSSMTSEEILSGSVADHWSVMVEVWSGVDWEVGEVYEIESEEPIPAIPGFKIPMVYRFSPVGRVPCLEGEGGADCIELRMHSAPDAKGVKELMERLIKQLGVDKRKQIMATLGSIEMETEVTVVADPATLVPFYLSRTKHLTVENRETGEQGRSDEVRTYRFYYE